MNAPQASYDERPHHGRTPRAPQDAWLLRLRERLDQQSLLGAVFHTTPTIALAIGAALLAWAASASPQAAKLNPGFVQFLWNVGSALVGGVAIRLAWAIALLARKNRLKRDLAVIHAAPGDWQYDYYVRGKARVIEATGFMNGLRGGDELGTNIAVASGALYVMASFFTQTFSRRNFAIGFVVATLATLADAGSKAKPARVRHRGVRVRHVEPPYVLGERTILVLEAHPSLSQVRSVGATLRFVTTTGVPRQMSSPSFRSYAGGTSTSYGSAGRTWIKMDLACEPTRHQLTVLDIDAAPLREGCDLRIEFPPTPKDAELTTNFTLKYPRYWEVDIEVTNALGVTVTIGQYLVPVYDRDAFTRDDVAA